jgi:hypothetical protein
MALAQFCPRRPVAGFLAPLRFKKQRPRHLPLRFALRVRQSPGRPLSGPSRPQGCGSHNQRRH